MAIKKYSNAENSQHEGETVVAGTPDVLQQAPSRMKKKRKFSSFLNLALLIILAALGYAYYLNAKELASIKDPNAQAEALKQEALATEADVRKLVLLPSDGEVPQVLIIQDATAAVAQQPSLAGVIDGDRVLLYAKSAKAFVYSPSRKILVNILPLTLQEKVPESAQQAASSANGSNEDSDTATAKASEKTR